jgi:lipoic acid synthetase
MQKPEWLTIKPASTESYSKIKNRIRDLGLHTVCSEAHCPNITECWSSGTATFMVLGGTCTRGCRFCAVQKSTRGMEVDGIEPGNLATAVKEWKLSYVVVTSVCRDDLPDQGSGHFAECIAAIKRENPKTVVEVLIPDFSNDASCLERIAAARPDVIGHNIETVERLSPSVRDRRASYRQSLAVLEKIKDIDKNIYTKSAIMLGLGESDDEVRQAMEDLRKSGVDFLAIGQYLRPSSSGFYADVKEYIKPEKFEQFRTMAVGMGFLYAAAGPFVRSSYKAGEFFIKAIVEGGRSHTT